MKNREELIREKIADEQSIERIQLRGIQRMVYHILTEGKRFRPEEIQINPQFSVKLQGEDAPATADFVISLENTFFIVIQCVSSGIESWERYVFAFARAVTDYQIPYAFITDGFEAKICEIINNSSRRVSVQNLLSREEAIILMKDFRKIPLPEERREREKRIICGFEAIKRKNF